MMVYAFKAGVSVLDEATLNNLMALQDFSLLYEGTTVDSKTGSGVTENNLANYSYCARFTLTGVTELTRIGLELDSDGTGADLVVQIRSGMDPANGVEGTTEIEVIVPAEFIPNPAAYWSIPINLTGLTSGGTYWIVVTKAGDTTNHLDWVGEASQDGSYPAYYRVGSSGAWTANNALHFYVYSGTDGKAVHEIYGTNGYVTITYSGDVPAKQYFYVPPPDGSAGGVRNILTLTYVSGVLTGGAVT